MSHISYGVVEAVEPESFDDVMIGLEGSVGVDTLAGAGDVELTVEPLSGCAGVEVEVETVEPVGGVEVADEPPSVIVGVVEASTGADPPAGGFVVPTAGDETAGAEEGAAGTDPADPQLPGSLLQSPFTIATQ